MKDTQELVCGNGGCNNGEAVAKLYKIVGSNGNVFEEKGARCQRCVDKAKASEVTYTPVEAPKPESPTEYDLSEDCVTPLSNCCDAPPIEHTEQCGKCKEFCMWWDDGPVEWEAAVAKALKESLQSKAVATAWNRTNRIPRIVGFDPHLPRQE